MIYHNYCMVADVLQGIWCLLRNCPELCDRNQVFSQCISQLYPGDSKVTDSQWMKLEWAETYESNACVNMSNVLRLVEKIAVKDVDSFAFLPNLKTRRQKVRILVEIRDRR
jgi:hypothetical protein